MKKSAFWSPYAAGAGLGLTLLATFYIAGRGLGASGAMTLVTAESAYQAALVADQTIQTAQAA